MTGKRSSGDRCLLSFASSSGGGLALLGLVSSSQADEEGPEFQVTYSGGQTVTTATPGSTTTRPYSLTMGIYGGGGKSNLIFEGDQSLWSILSSGTVTVTIKFVGTKERPKTAILTVFSKAAFYGGTGSAANGLGSPVVQDGTWKKSEGTTYVALAFPSFGDLQYTIAPQASATNSGSLTCGTNVALVVSAAAVRINLEGVLDPVNDKRLIIGQRLKATLDWPASIAGTNPVWYTWQATGGRPFKSYVATQSQSSFTPFLLLSSPNTYTTIYFAAPAQDVSITCDVNLPALSLSFTTSTNVTSEAPTVSGVRANIGNFQYLPSPTNPDYFKLYGETPPGTTWEVGVYEIFWVTTQQEYWQLPQKGQYCWTQLFEDKNMSNTDNGGWLSISIGPGTHLDGSQPYPYGGWFVADGPRIIDNQHTQFFRDSPGFGSISVLPSSTEFHTSYGRRYDTDFHLFVMYDPSGTATMEVPIALRNWFAKGEFMFYKPSTWGPTSDSSSLGGSTAFPDHPIWPYP